MATIENHIFSRLDLSPSCLRRLLVLSDCNTDGGESGSGRLVLCESGALSPSEVERRSSPRPVSSDGGLRRLIPPESPNGSADLSGIIRFDL